MNEILTGQRILVIEDDPVMLDIIKQIISGVNAIASGVSSVEKGLHMSRCHEYDLIVLDRYMPDGDGHDVLRALKSNVATKDTPVLMLTGETKSDQIRESIDLGAVGYIVKPFKPKDFIAWLEKILR